MCYNCEGEVDLDVIVCPFCAADLREEKPEQLSPHFKQTVQKVDAQESLYPTHYASRIREEEEKKTAAPIQNEEEEPKVFYGPIILLTLGAQLLLLGLFMLFFANKGELVLKWDARFWYFYVLASIPLFTFVVKSLKKL